MISIYIRGVAMSLLTGMVFCHHSMAQTSNTDSIVVGRQAEKQVAYGAQPSWMMTGAISSVKGSELSKSFTSNLSNTLYGRLPGLTVMQGSGEPGSDTATLHIRGLATYGSGSAPLILVDGFESSYQQLNPEEIESIEVLKDAAATAMYGSRGANGVFLVTTRRGKTGPMEVNFSIQQGIQQAMRLPKFLNSYQYATLYNEALANDGKPAQYSAADLAAYKDHSDPYFHPDVNWYDQVLRKSSPIGSYGLNFNGGSKDVRYYVLLNAMLNGGLYRNMGDQSGTSTGEHYNRYNFRTNVDVQLTKRMSVQFNLGGSVEDWASPAGTNTTGMFNLLGSLPPNAFPVYNPNGSLGGSSLYSNPVGNLLKTGTYTSNGRTMQTIFKLTQQLDMFAQGLSISGAVSFNSFFRNYSNKTAQYAQYALSKDLSGNTQYTQFGQNTSLADDESQSQQWRNAAGQLFLNYDRTIGKHRLSGVILFNADNYNMTGYNQSFQHQGVGGRLTYANSEKYIAEFSFGYNGSNNFPDGHRYGFFPAGSLGWVASNEDFLKNSRVISYLKVRASYGMTGNDNIGGQRFMYDQYYPNTPQYFFGTQNSGTPGIAEGAQANPAVTWERQWQLDFGIEATFLQRLSLSLDIFNQDRDNILSTPGATIPEYSGIILPMLNVGRVNNKGFEAGLEYNNMREGGQQSGAAGNSGRKWQYHVGINVWYAKNKIEYDAEPLAAADYLYASGRPIGQPFVLQALGFFKDQADIDASPHQNFGPVQPGDIKYKDQNKDGIVDQNDLYPIGKTNIPQLTFGLNAGVSYAGFDLDVLFQAVTDRTVYLSGSYVQAFQNNGQAPLLAMGRWTTPTATTASYPRLSSTNNVNDLQPSSFWQRNGSFIKLRSVELGYTMKENLFRNWKMRSARVFINGTNLLSIDHMHGLTDPETLYEYPAVRTLSAGLKIGI